MGWDELIGPSPFGTLQLNNCPGTFQTGACAIPTDDWQLPAANFVSAKMPMYATHPRPEVETDTWEMYRNAYPGIPYSCEIDIQGGAFPFHHEVITGPPGLTIGQDLIEVGDHLEIPDDYGRVYWPNPTLGVHPVHIRVFDQDNATPLDIVFSITVGVAGWLFVDPLLPAPTGDGTKYNPFKLLSQITNNDSTTTTYADHRIILRSGVTQLEGMPANNNNFRLDPNTNPLVITGYPGESVQLEMYEGWFVLSGTSGFQISNLTVQYAPAFTPGGGTEPIYMFNAIGSFDRGQFHNVVFKDFKGDPLNVGQGNSAVAFFSNAPRNHISFKKCSATGITGNIVDCYNWRHSVIDQFKMYDAIIATSDGSSHGPFFVKQSPDHVTLRNIDIWDNVTIDFGAPHPPGSLISYGGGSGAENLEFCYCTIEASLPGGRDGTLAVGSNNAVSDLIENIYVFRNSIKDSVLAELEAHTNMPDGTEIHEKNILDTGIMPTSVKITNIDNLDGTTYFDTNMKLIDRVTNLGKRGAEISK